VDVIAALTESRNPQVYWRVLKKRLLTEGNESVTNCNALKMTVPDGKQRLADVVNTEFRRYHVGAEASPPLAGIASNSVKKSGAWYCRQFKLDSTVGKLRETEFA
jgi:hypothetical protein